MADSARTPAPGEIIPVDGWAFKGEHGHMAFETTKGGRLVRLADLVQWLMDTEGLPCGMAVDDVCQNLQAPDATTWLYMVTPGKMARPLTGKDDFSWHPIIVGRDPEPDPAHCGIAGAVHHMRSLWGYSASPSECTYIGANYLDPLAIRMDKSHELWGWGSVAAPVALVLPLAPVVAAAVVPPLSAWEQLIKDRNDEERFLWSPARALVVQAEETRLKAVSGAKGVRKAMAAKMSEGGKPITPQKLFEAMRENLPNAASKGKATG